MSDEAATHAQGAAGEGPAAAYDGGAPAALPADPARRVRIVVADDHEVVREGFAAMLATQPDFEVVGTAADGAQAVRIAAAVRPDVVLMDVRMPGMDGIEATRRLLGPAAQAPDSSPRPPGKAGRAAGESGSGPGGPAGLGDPPSMRVLILTTFDLDEYVYEALRAGASGFLLKDASAERLFDAVRVVAAGDALIAPSITRRLIGEFARQGTAASASAPSTGTDTGTGPSSNINAGDPSGTPSALGSAADVARTRALSTLTPRETQVLRLVAEGLSNPEIAVRLTVTEETVKTHVSRVLGKLGLRDRTQAVVAAYESGLVVPHGRSGPAPRA